MRLETPHGSLLESRLAYSAGFESMTMDLRAGLSKSASTCSKMPTPYRFLLGDAYDQETEHKTVALGYMAYSGRFWPRFSASFAGRSMLSAGELRQCLSC